MKLSKFLLIPILSITLFGCGSNEPTPSSAPVIPDSSNEKGSMSYEIFVRSFYDSDGDGVGDILGVKKKIPYLADLGIKTVWLMPVHNSPSYHGYDVSDYYSINKDYGTLDDFDALVEEANKYNIDIMLDMVFNHCATNNTYFQESYQDYINNNTSENSKADWFHWSTTKKDPKTYYKYNNLYYEGRFSSSMPDFDLNSQGVRNEIENITKYWIKEHGVKGFRLDAVLYYYFESFYKSRDFLTWLEEMSHKYDENFYMVGEAWVDGEAINDFHTSKLDSFFRFDNAYSGEENMCNIAKGIGYGNLFLNYIEENEAIIKENNPNGYASYFLSNHDQDRVSKSLDEIQNKCAASLLCLLPGTPFMYYGEEIQLKGVRKTDPDDMSDARRRLPMVWSKEDKTGECKFPEKNRPDLKKNDQVELGVEDQLKNEQSLLNHYKRMIHIRNQYPFLKHGVFKSLYSSLQTSEKAVLAYKISLGNDYIIVVHNFSNETKTVNAIGNTILDNINVSNELANIKDGKLTLGTYSSVVLK